MQGTIFAVATAVELLAIALCFVWSGFVRSGIGFGGAALTLPMLLMINNNPLLFLPAISWQLLLFSLLTIATRLENVNWSYLLRLSLLLAIPFAAGLFGLLNLPATILSLFVYTVTLGYGLMYVFNREFVSNNRYVDAVCLIAGGYISGVSLIGAPLIASVAVRQLPSRQLRDTLFVMWIILVIFKLGTFFAADVNQQWLLVFLTLPFVALGHILGLRFHEMLVSGDKRRFHQVLGFGLSLVSAVGLWSVL